MRRITKNKQRRVTKSNNIIVHKYFGKHPLPYEADVPPNIHCVDDLASDLVP